MYLYIVVIHIKNVLLKTQTLIFYSEYIVDKREQLKYFTVNILLPTEGSYNILHSCIKNESFNLSSLN